MEDKLRRISYLTLGGWDEKDYVGDIAWYDTSQSGSSWNLTATQFNLNHIDLLPDTKNDTSNRNPTVMLQTGYPYIGVQERVFDTICSELSFDVPGLQCQKGQHFGKIRLLNNWHVGENPCSSMGVILNFTITMGDY